MKIIDYFLYITYRFAHNTLKKDISDAKWSAFLHTSLYLLFFVVVVICFSGLIFDNAISQLLKNIGFLAWLIIDIFVILILALKFYRYKGVAPIEDRYLSFTIKKQILIKWSVYLIMIILPILLFVIYRLYVVGHIKWW